MEQQQIRHGNLPPQDDDQLGHCLQCLVLAPDDQAGKSAEPALPDPLQGCPFLLLHGVIFPQPEEDAVQFANRVKSAIARQGGLVDLLW